MVEPDAFLIVELRAGLRTAADVERLDQFVEREDFLFGTGVPAQHGQEVDDGLGEIATLAVTRAYLARLGVVPLKREHGESQAVAVALRQFALALGLEQQGQMGEAGHGVLPAESLVEQHMQGRTGQPLLTTDDMRDLHEVVVYDIGQVIGGQFVGTLVKHLIVEDVALDTHLAANHIVDQHLAAGLNLEAHHILAAILYLCVHLLGAHGQRVTHLTARMGIVLEILNLSTLGLQLLGSIEGDVSLASIEQLVDIFLIDVTTLTLTVRSLGTAEAHTLVEFEAEPAERLDDILLGSGHEAVGVGVLNTKHKVAPMLAGEEIVEQGGAHTTYV